MIRDSNDTRPGSVSVGRAATHNIENALKGALKLLPMLESGNFGYLEEYMTSERKVTYVTDSFNAFKEQFIAWCQAYDELEAGKLGPYAEQLKDVGTYDNPVLGPGIMPVAFHRMFYASPEGPTRRVVFRYVIERIRDFIPESEA